VVVGGGGDGNTVNSAGYPPTCPTLYPPSLPRSITSLSLLAITHPLALPSRVAPHSVIRSTASSIGHGYHHPSSDHNNHNHQLLPQQQPQQCPPISKLGIYKPYPWKNSALHIQHMKLVSTSSKHYKTSSWNYQEVLDVY
jgi:hypothetical protein